MIINVIIKHIGFHEPFVQIKKPYILFFAQLSLKD